MTDIFTLAESLFNGLVKPTDGYYYLPVVRQDKDFVRLKLIRVLRAKLEVGGGDAIRLTDGVAKAYEDGHENEAQAEVAI